MTIKTASMKYDDLTIDAPLGAVKLFRALQLASPNLRIEVQNGLNERDKLLVRLGSLFLDETSVEMMNAHQKAG